MIKAVRCDQESFRDVEFTSGLNVVLAERADTSTEKDSRNGLGKSTLIEIIRFCFGSGPHKDAGIFSVKVLGWTYSLEMIIQGQTLIISRRTDDPRTVIVNSSFDYETLETLSSDPVETQLSTEKWREFLGKVMFDLHPTSDRNYVPTFGSLIAYFTRATKDAYTFPFDQHRKQLEWDKQVNNAFLLGLAWEDASDLQDMKEEKADLELRTRLLAQQVQGNPKKLLGVMEANRVQLMQKLSQEERALRSFQVHPRYRDINDRVDKLTEAIHAQVNANVADSQIIELYQTSDVSDEMDTEQLTRLYEEADVVLPEIVQRRLSDVREFHQQVILNRQNFLVNEISRLQRQVVARTREIESMSEERAANMVILETHGALGEYNRLQKLSLDARFNLSILENQINEIRGLEQRKSQFRIELEQLQQRMRDDYDARSNQRQQAIEIFNSNSEIIYDVQGTLIINVADTGFKFDVIIKRDGSDGIGNMKVFCYDLMLAELWSEKSSSPGFLIHDSIIFDGVDERQVKNALELAASTSKDQNFQYICTINSDNVPYNEFSSNFDFNQYVRLILTDDTEAGGLLGIRF